MIASRYKGVKQFRQESTSRWTRAVHLKVEGSVQGKGKPHSRMRRRVGLGSDQKPGYVPRVGVAVWVFLSASPPSEEAVSRAVWVPDALEAAAPSVVSPRVEVVPRAGWALARPAVRLQEAWFRVEAVRPAGLAGAPAEASPYAVSPRGGAALQEELRYLVFPWAD
jgi:hypothetical protein